MRLCKKQSKEMTAREWFKSESELPSDIWKKKYQNDGESFYEFLERVSNGNDEIHELILNKEFIFGGRILANRGLHKDGRKVTYSNCYVLPAPEDNLESIFSTAKDLARTFSYGGGVGVDLSNLRPRGMKVNNAAKETSGAVSFMDLYSLTTEIIGQAGRRGALMLSMNVSHPDIQDFIKIKSDLDKVQKANISVMITDEFMKAVKTDSKFKTEFEVKDTGERFSNEIDAKKLFMELCRQNWDYAEPGLLFWDRVNNYNLMSEDKSFSYAGTNPCVTGDTLISTTEGYIKIKDLVGHTPHVYCMDDENGGKLTIRQASKVWMTRKNAKLVKVISGKGEITCTPDHKIFTKNRGWVEAKDLKKGDKLKGLNRQTTGHKYCSISLSGDKYIKEHRFVKGHFEDIEGKDVHHLNDNGFDNRLSNLLAETHSEHSVRTNTGRIIEHNRDDLGRYSEKDIKAKRTTKNLGKKVGTNWFIKEVIELDYTEDVYDMTVPEVHNFVANDMVIHNCAEEPLPAGGSCLLGSLILPTFVIDGKFKLDKFDKAVRTSVRALNDVLDEGLPLHPLKVQRDTVRDLRQIGLGVLGIGDMLIKLGLVYGSDKSIEICDVIARALAEVALNESARLAKSYGAFPSIDTESILKSEYFIKHATDETLELVKQYGLRNSQLLTIAPTGSIGTMLEMSTGIEPNFAFSYMRKTESLHGEDVFYKVMTKISKEYMENNNIEEEKDLPEWFVTAQNLDPIRRIKMQATWQNRIDAAISSTVNLVKESTVEDVFNIYMEAWEKGLKGTTIYRAGCAREGILTVDGEETKVKKELIRGELKTVAEDTIYHPRTIHIGCGKIKLMIGYANSEPGKIQDIYAIRSGTGGCEKNIQSTVIYMSGMLRLGGDLGMMNKAISGISTCASFTSKKNTSKGGNCPTAILFAVEDFLKQKNLEINNVEEVKEQIKLPEKIEETKDSDKKGNVCPECGELLEASGGCISCRACGYSKCE